MPLQSSGSISLNQIHVEGGGSSGSNTSLNDADCRNLIFKTANTSMSFSDWYGAGKVNGEFQLQEITISNFISSGGTFTIPSGAWIWSDSTSTPAITVDIPCTIINNGYIIGKGGNGGSIGSLNGTNGGPAMNITASSVFITNNSGAFIAGGGGGGAASSLITGLGGYGYVIAAGGGGAGGGSGGSGGVQNIAPVSYVGKAGGAINSEGGTQFSTNNQAGGHGGSSGGGRILPGTESVGTGNFWPITWPVANWGCGGGANNPGIEGGLGRTATYNTGFTAGCGGGGWGAAGGNCRHTFTAWDGTYYPNFYHTATGGSGGNAISKSGSGAYSLTNNGTVYGTTA